MRREGEDEEAEDGGAEREEEIAAGALAHGADAESPTTERTARADHRAGPGGRAHHRRLGDRTRDPGHERRMTGRDSVMLPRPLGSQIQAYDSNELGWTCAVLVSVNERTAAQWIE